MTMTGERAQAAPALPPDELRGLLTTMLVIRHFEDRVFELFASGKVGGSTHLCQGQEATEVGACAALRADDLMVCTYRGHGASIAKGMDVRAAFAEILGKETGCCGGKGGSMHLTDVAHGAMGSFAIVGAGIPLAAGLGWAARLQGTGQVVLSFCGDAATNIGAFHEGLNVASVWKLPVVFVCENNLYGEYSPIAATTPIQDLARRADAYGMPGLVVDGNDVEAVYWAVHEAVGRARRGEGPTLLECKTYRQRGHSRSDPGTYRPPAEVEHWLRRDPIRLLRTKLVGAAALTEPEADALDEAALERVRDAEGQALADDFPAPERLFADVYAEA
jgi:acetoin:2,6-dichlorophenolindophenol oxidoreductase subunit alpha